MTLQQTRAARMLARICGLILAGFCVAAFAGNQKEEALGDSVKMALARSIADPTPPVQTNVDIEERIKYLHWLGEMSDRLRKKLPDTQVRLEFLRTTWYESRRAGLDPGMVLGLIQPTYLPSEAMED